MNKSITFFIILSISFFSLPNKSYCEIRDRVIFENDTDVFKRNLWKKTDPNHKLEDSKPILKMDFSQHWIPKSVKEFKQVWHNPSVSQDLTGNCWAFSSISFFESEINRIIQKDVRLSSNYVVYWEYMKKADEYLRTKGKSYFGKGSQDNAILRVFEKHGIVPEEDYVCRKTVNGILQDDPIYNEVLTSMTTALTNKNFSQKAALQNVQSILNKYLGEPPDKINVDGKLITPKEYLKDVVKITPADYVCIISLMQNPYYQKVEYPVSDNWWHNRDYYNVPLDEFMSIIKKSIRSGYSLGIVGDNSEPGFSKKLNVAMIPSFDIPSQNIDDNARQYRFDAGETTDDHAIHLVGYLEKDGKDWYLIKDSGTKARNGKNPGYIFYQEDFVKLKMMYVMVHKDMVKDVLSKF